MTESYASLENVIDGVQAARGQLPLQELALAADQTHKARQILAELVANTTGVESFHALFNIVDIPTFSAASAQAELTRADTSLETYIGSITLGTDPVVADKTSLEPTPASGRVRRAKLTDPRKTFMSTTGFGLYTNMNDRLLEDLSKKSLRPVDPNQPQLDLTPSVAQNNPAGTSLFLAIRSASELLPRSAASFLRKFRIKSHDRSESERHAFFDNGFGDMGFTWHFSAGVANTVVDFFIDQGVMTQSQKDAFTLKDWANIIGSGWFSRLMHSMALTSNGVYLDFGDRHENYGYRAFHAKLRSELLANPLSELFTYQEQTEDGHRYATAALTPQFTKNLRDEIYKNRRTIGCPVARNSIRLPADQLKKDDHLKELIANGALTVVGDPDKEGAGTVQLVQGWTAIDKTLAFVAMQLEQYEERFGTPRLVTIPNSLSYDLEHVTREQANALRWPA